MRAAGVGLGQLLLALDATLVSLVDAPRGLDLQVGSAALIDSDDVRLGLAAAASSADVFFLLGVADDEALRWMDKQARERVPVAIFVKEPSNALVAKAVAAGSAVVAAEPRARWERLYLLVNHVLEHHGDRGDPVDDSGTDLFGLAQSLADRIHGMVSIENAQSHVLAYSALQDREFLLEASASHWDKIHAVNARGAFLMTREIAKAMVAAGRGGRIVNIASNAVRGGLIKGLAAYTSSKGAVLALSRVSAFELAEHQITVNTVLPGAVITPGAVSAKGPLSAGPATRRTPFGFQEPREIGAAVLFFASDAARPITNQVLAVDGGFSIT